MNLNPSSIIPITKARTKLGDLAEKVTGENYIVLTKDGSPKAALVDISYLVSLEKEVKNIYKKTFLDKKLLKYTRDFSDEEIKQWLDEDSL